MRIKPYKTLNKAAARASRHFSFVAVAAFAQQQVNLTAGPATMTLPDGSIASDVGLQLRRGCGWLHSHLRQVKSHRHRLVPRGDYGSHGTGPADQPH